MRLFHFVRHASFRCFWLGAIATLALSPLDFWPAALALVPPLLMMASAASARMAARCAFMTSWGWLSASLYWIGESLLVEGGVALLLLPVVLLGLPAALALFWAVFVAAAYRCTSSPVLRLVLIALAIGSADITRSIVLTGFPWNVMAHLFLATDISAQAVYFVGQHALNLVAMASIAGIALIWQRQIATAVWLLLPAIILIVLGGHRLAGRETAMLSVAPAGTPADIRIIQPNIDQKEKWKREQRNQHLAKMVEIAHQHMPLPPLLILPETAITTLWPADAEKTSSFIQDITPFDGYLLAGMLRLEERTRLYNSAFLFSHQGQPVARYDKIHLVPFGEYVPFRFIPYIDVIAGPIDFSSGAANQSYLHLPEDSPLAGLKIAMLICYEVIFPGFLDRTKAGDAEFGDVRTGDIIVNLTNDGWFGHTSGPYQHLAQTRFRAIEDAKPLIRVANTGISAVFDSYGAELGRIALAQSGHLDIRLSDNLAQTAQRPFLHPLSRQIFTLTMLACVLSIYLLPLFALEFWRQTKDKNNSS
jgi:apolipoprotein N-acyltransferase